MRITIFFLLGRFRWRALLLVHFQQFQRVLQRAMITIGLSCFAKIPEYDRSILFNFFATTPLRIQASGPERPNGAPEARQLVKMIAEVSSRLRSGWAPQLISCEAGSSLRGAGRRRLKTPADDSPRSVRESSRYHVVNIGRKTGRKVGLFFCFHRQLAR